MNSYRAYCKDGNKKAFRDAHRSDLDLHDAAHKELLEIFENGKFPSIQALKEEKASLTSRKKAITGKKLGDAFEKAAVDAAILGTVPITFVQVEQKLESQRNRQITGTESIGRVVDMEHNEKVKTSAGYEQWAKIHNLQEQAKTFNFLTENGLLDAEKLDDILAEVTADFKQKKEEMKVTETRLKEVNRELRLLGQ